ncbi:MAG: hypothetical protein IJM30_06305 [Thermoguttaceae bacterium]|nr:hypothetical protein [Thermoguttaceae bacterium]
MFVSNDDASRKLSDEPKFDESKRRDLRRLALAASAILLGSTVLFSSGCQTTKSRKTSKTVDDFLQADKPQW